MSASTENKVKEQEEEPQGWKQVDSATEFFVDWIRPQKDKPSIWTAIFSFGTVVSFLADKAPIRADWSFNPKADYPTHRVPEKKELKRIYAQNAKIYKDTLTKHATHNDVIQQAYKMLIGCGYPLPGGEGADTDTAPLCVRGDKVLWAVGFPYLDNEGDFPIYSLAITDGVTPLGEIDAFGREMRRWDFMFPRIHALITDDLNVIRL